jgi:RND family efflux transporter MFP subunit
MKNVLKYSLATLIAAIIFFIIFHERSEKEYYTKNFYDEEITVDVIEAKPNDNFIPLKLPTYAKANHEADIYSRVLGYVKNFYVDIGDVVKEGQLLMEIETPELDQEVEKVRENFIARRALRDIAKITKIRWEDLYKLNPEAVPYQEVQEKQAEYAAQEAALLAVEREKDRFEVRMGFKKIYAPFDGVISERNVDEGQLVDIGSNKMSLPLFKIIDSSIIRFFIEVPQEYFRNIEEGISVSIQIPEYPEKIFKSNVTRFAKSLNAEARTLLTEVDINNSDSIIYPGLFAVATFDIKPKMINFIIPTQALIIRSGPPEVAVIDDQNIVRIKEVKIGYDAGSFVQIIEGLKVGDRIIKSPYSAIKEGIKVKTKA